MIISVRRLFLLFVGFCIFVVYVTSPALAENLQPDYPVNKFISLGTASKQGVYSPVGQSICKQLNRGRLTHGFRCLAYNTGGSMYNLSAVTSSSLDLDVALTRADLVHGALEKETASSQANNSKQLMAVAFLYHEAAAVLVKNDSNITSLNELPGKRINIGNPGSGKRVLSEILFEAMGWSTSDFSEVLELGTKAMAKAFCEDRVDVLVQMMGVPANFYEQLGRDCDARFIDLTPQAIEKITSLNPAFKQLTISPEFLPNTARPITTIGGNVLLITSSSIHPDSIYQLTKSMAGNIEEFRDGHPVLKPLNLDMMASEIKGIPIHPGARRYYQEAGLLPRQEEK